MKDESDITALKFSYILCHSDLQTIKYHECYSHYYFHYYYYHY